MGYKRYLVRLLQVSAILLPSNGFLMLKASLCSRPHKQQTKCDGSVGPASPVRSEPFISLLRRAHSGRAILIRLRKIGYSFVLRIFFWLFSRSLVCWSHSGSSSESKQLQQYLFGFVASRAHFWLRFALLLWNFLLLCFSSLPDLLKK